MRLGWLLASQMSVSTTLPMTWLIPQLMAFNLQALISVLVMTLLVVTHRLALAKRGMH